MLERPARKPSFRPALENLERRDTPAVILPRLALVIHPALLPPAHLNTTEAGAVATFTVALSRQPARATTYFLKSDDLTEGKVDHGSVTFTRANWNRPQIIKVKGQNDTIVDNDVTYHVLFSTNARFLGTPAAKVTLVNKDLTKKTTLADFNGTYSGTFEGSAATMLGTQLFHGTFQLKIVNGVITLLAPVTGTGHLQLTGGSSFTISTGLLAGVTFNGSFHKGTGTVTANGTWSGEITMSPFGSVSGHGTWTVTRTGAAS